MHGPGRPPHIGVLLDNVPDHLLWLGAAALSGAVVVGVDSTYRGDRLAQLVRHTDCQVLVTSSGHLPLLDGADTGVSRERILVVDGPGYAARPAASSPEPPARRPREDDLFLLIFTSGSTGLPKAVRCTQGRFARTGAHVAAIAGLGDGDAVYPDTGEECPPVTFGPDGRYWSGDLAYRDATGGCTSPDGPTSGFASTARTSPPRPSKRSSRATPTSAPSPSTPSPTTRSATESWRPSNCGPVRSSIPAASTPSSPRRTISARSGRPRSSS
ncbi:hypothetical protein BJF79_15310 [Actinomadura sp. CNU-125]|nr:hypothetical protein BJF79_15310 [Actinomadura sp. CNU-125]